MKCIRGCTWILAFRDNMNVQVKKQELYLKITTLYVFIFLFPFFAPTGAWGIHETSRFTSVSLSRTDGKSPWTSDQLIARPVATQDNTNRINVHIHINIHASSRIQTYNPGIQESQDSLCLTSLSYCDRHVFITNVKKMGWVVF
jgi:hypothetical protein